MEPCALSSQILGDGPPLIILHGLFGAGRNWGTIARSLSATYQVHCLDLRNHGDSPWSPAMTYPLMAADVEAYLDAHGIVRCDLLGHSMGGKAAMMLAMAAPERLRHLIVVDIAPVANRRDGNAGYIAALLAVPLATVTRRADVDAMLLGDIPDPTIRAFLLQNLVSTPEGGFRWRLNLSAIAGNREAILDFPTVTTRFLGPTTFIAGEYSDYIRPRDEAIIRHYFPNATIVEIGETGHWPHAERPQRFVEVVTDALAARSAGDGHAA